MTLIFFLCSLKFIGKIHNYEVTLDDARNYQTELRILTNKLNNNYNPRNNNKKKRRKGKIAFQNLQGNCQMREKILLVFLKKELFRIKVMYLKQKKKNQKMNQKKNQKKNQKRKESKNLSNVLRMNQRV